VGEGAGVIAVGAGILVAGLAATGPSAKLRINPSAKLRINPSATLRINPSTLLRTNSFLRHDLTIARAFYNGKRILSV
jgi:hypothetical protein